MDGMEPVVRYSPDVRELIDAMTVDRLSPRVDADWAASLLTTTARQVGRDLSAVAERAHQLGLRMKLDPVVFSEVERTDNTWRIEATQQVRFVRVTDDVEP